MFLLVSVRHVGAHPGEHQHGVSIQISISLGKTFLRISRIRNIPLTWILARVFAYLPPFISQILDFIYWTVLIFLSILNGVTLKTSNMFALLEIARIYKARKLFADLQRPICYKDPQNKGINLIVYSLFTLWPKFGNHWISRIGSLRFWWNSVQRKALIRTICSREIFTKKCRQQQNFDSDPKEAWHYNHVTFTPIAKNFMLYCRLIYMLSILCVRLTIKVKVGIPESFKVGWYPHKITGSSHLKLWIN